MSATSPRPSPSSPSTLILAGIVIVVLVVAALTLGPCKSGTGGLHICQVTKDGSVGEPLGGPDTGTRQVGGTYRTDGPCAPGDVDLGD